MRSLPRFVVNRFLVRQLPRPFRHEGGDCYSAGLPALLRYADDESVSHRSTLALYEDGLPLQQPHCSINAIRELGIGRYAHWEDRLYFSTTDNSDPNINGRDYDYSISPWLYRRRVHRPELDPGLPVNHRKRDCTEEKFRADVAYALSNGRDVIAAIQRLGMSVAGKTFLEIGPGINMGCPLVVAAYGAKPIVVDRFLAPWDRSYHGQFYARLREELKRTDPGADVRPLTAVLEARGYPEDVIRRISAPLETAPLPDGHCDFVRSNAVLEHVFDLDASFSQLYRVTRPGGYHLHQVDFRDHRNFDRPLEYLLISERDFAATFEEAHSGCGNRWRVEEMTERFLAAGFELMNFHPTEFVKSEYLRTFVPRLRRCGSRYRDWPEDKLQVLGGHYTLRRPLD
ncbi:MAG TPA: methyltransferase domain-containing protein [Gemmataceae bacterium]|nr:methyltransferase domain-containing protein [Gemmataceae bacterium]